MTDKKRQEMKDYKEKAMAFEHKLKGKRISLDSGVMIASTEMQKHDNYESPISNIKESVYSDVINENKILTQNTVKTNDSNSPETPTLISEEEENNNLYDSPSTEEAVNKKSEVSNLVENSSDTLSSKQELSPHSTASDSTHNEDNSIIPEPISRLRSNSYTLSSPSPVMVAFLNSQVQQQLREPKSLENTELNKKSKSEPTSICVTNDDNEKVLAPKSISLHSVSELIINQEIVNNSVKYDEQTVINNDAENENIIIDHKDDERGSMTTIETNFSNDESVVGSVITVYNGNSYENNSSLSSMTCKSTKHCCCRHSDDEYSFSSNVNFKTPDELNLEAERLRLAKLDLEIRHQEELSSLIKKQREEQEQIAVRYYLVSQTQNTSSGISLDGSECSESYSKQPKSGSLSIKTGITVTNDRSMSDTSSIISNCSINKNIVCSSPRQKTPSRSPNLQKNIQFYHRIRGGIMSKLSKAPTEVENSAATVINSGVRGYLTRRLLRTEKAQLLKKTILDSLKTALVMHMELKKQQPTESDLQLHQRIINQVIILIFFIVKKSLNFSKPIEFLNINYLCFIFY